MPTKQTVKSCSCRSCKQGRSSRAAKLPQHACEKAARRTAKQAIKRGTDENLTPAHRGPQTD